MEMNNLLLVEFGKRLKYLRQKIGVSQLEMSYRCDINRNYYSDLERGRRNPTLTVLFKISKGFEISLKDLFAGIGIYK